MPWFVGDTLLIILRKRHFKVEFRRIGLEPFKRVRIFKIRTKIRSWDIAIADINGISRVVFTVAGGGTHIGPLAGGLRSFLLDVEEDAFLIFDRSKGGQRHQTNACGLSLTYHGLVGGSGSFAQPDAPVSVDGFEFGFGGFCVRIMAENRIGRGGNGEGRSLDVFGGISGEELNNSRDED